LTIEIAIAPFCSFIRSRTHFPPMLKVWVTEGIKKWLGPLRETPPSPPKKCSNAGKTPEVLFIDTIKGKTESTPLLEVFSGEGGRFPEGGRPFFYSPLPPPLRPTLCHGFRVRYLIIQTSSRTEYNFHSKTSPTNQCTISYSKCMS